MSGDSRATYTSWVHTCFSPSPASLLAEEAFTKENDSRHSPNSSNNDSQTASNVANKKFSIGTYNLLHPIYAKKYHDPIGLNVLGLQFTMGRKGGAIQFRCALLNYYQTLKKVLWAAFVW